MLRVYQIKNPAIVAQEADFALFGLILLLLKYFYTPATGTRNVRNARPLPSLYQFSMDERK